VSTGGTITLIWLVGFLVTWVPITRWAARGDDLFGDTVENAGDLYFGILLCGVAAMLWPVVLTGLGLYRARHGVERVFVGKPRKSRSQLEARIEELERETGI